MRAARFLYGTDISKCCKAKTLLVKSRDGGFISQNCLRCGRSGYIAQERLPELNCDFCGGRLHVKKLDGSDYHYVCGGCNRAWKLAENLPDWSELFSYCGLAAYGDGEAFAR